MLAGAIRSAPVEAAFRAVRRHWFLPGAALDDVYRDRALVTHRAGNGVAISSSSQPALMAQMLDQLSVEPGMAVLEIGTGTGYNAALLGQLVGPAGAVLTIDVDPVITGPARRHLAAAGASNVEVVTGDGWQPETGARFDRIEATVGVWDLSPAWVERLEPGGVLVAPLWLRAGQQVSVAFRLVDRRLESAGVVPCGFMRLRGPGAGAPTYHRIGPWTVSLDEASPDRVDALVALLDSDSSAQRLPALEHGWFTLIALREPDAVHLFAEGSAGPLIRSGILQTSPPGLAVVETSPGAPDVLRSFGSDEARQRLVDLLRRVPAVDPAELAISAIPAPAEVADEDALAKVVRPNFTFVVRHAGGASASWNQNGSSP